MITSAHNPKVKWVRSLQARSRARKEAGAFVVEGVRLLEEALAAAWKPLFVIHTQELNPRGMAAIARLAAEGVEITLVTPEIMQAASDTHAPQGVLAVLELDERPLPAQLDFVLITDGVRDPGNLGTLLRTAAAAGVQAVLLSPGSADPYHPKVVRAGMGAHFRLPVRSLDWPQVCAVLKGDAGRTLQVFLAVTNAGLPYTQADFHLPLALIVGGEAEGAGQQASRMADSRIHIPMPGGGESLNVAVAAAVILFEVVRQRDLHNR